MAVLLALITRTFILQAFSIPSGSMLESLQIGDHILVNKLIYKGLRIPCTDLIILQQTKPKYEDIIVFKYPKNPKLDYVKRIIGVPGDIVESFNGKIHINQKKTLQSYAKIEKKNNLEKNYGPIIIPKNKFFVLGDNRNNSIDSRSWGFVNLQSIKGKVFIVYWSWSWNSGIRWNRIFFYL